jgi:septal ring factor EnvC (AmiA/AmiB activator)
MISAVLVAVIVGLLAGFLWWGIPTGRLETELQDARAGAARLSQQLDDLQKRDRDLAAELKAQKTRLETTERDLRVEKDMNSRLHLLVSQGKK